MFEVDLRLCCDWLCKVVVCFCYIVFDGAWRLNVMLGLVVIGDVHLVRVFVCRFC